MGNFSKDVLPQDTFMLSLNVLPLRMTTLDVLTLAMRYLKTYYIRIPSDVLLYICFLKMCYLNICFLKMCYLMSDAVSHEHAVVLALEDANVASVTVPGSRRSDGLTDDAKLPRVVLEIQQTYVASVTKFGEISPLGKI